MDKGRLVQDYVKFAFFKYIACIMLQLLYLHVSTMLENLKIEPHTLISLANTMRQ